MPVVIIKRKTGNVNIFQLKRFTSLLRCGINHLSKGFSFMDVGVPYIYDVWASFE